MNRTRYLYDEVVTPPPADWKAALPEDVRGADAISKFTGPDHLARSYVSLSARLGNPDGFMALPKAGDEKALTETLRKLGAPERVEGYKITLDPKLPVDIVGADKPLGKVFLNAAHAAGLLPSQAQGVYAAVAAAIAQSHEQAGTADAAKHKANEDGLRKEWGPAFDKHIALGDAAIDKAATAGKFDGNALRETIKAAGLGTDPAFLKLLAFAGSLTAEPGIDAKGGNTAGFGQGTPAEHESRAKEYQRQAINNPDAGERRRLNALANKEWELAVPTKK